MKEMRLFYTPVWQTNVAEDQADWSTLRAAMLERIRALESTGQGVQRTNFGGWQSDDDLYKHREFNRLTQRIMALANQVAPQFSAKASFDDGILWANVNRRGDFNAMHTHPDAILSGCIYLKVDSADQGAIQFLDAREGSPTSHWRCYTRLNDSTPLTEQAVTVTPREGDILFFPGWLRHWVTPNLTDQERVSVAFNIRMN
ncbi:MAG: 2OG-Fe(II) oxygenase family protein [Proteobacteria bacterium]|nr:2OG-Fe(II) oxygenase family protein [Pseudomonadota bacterium]